MTHAHALVAEEQRNTRTQTLGVKKLLVLERKSWRLLHEKQVLLMSIRKHNKPSGPSSISKGVSHNGIAVDPLQTHTHDLLNVDKRLRQIKKAIASTVINIEKAQEKLQLLAKQMEAVYHTTLPKRTEGVKDLPR